VCLLVFYESLLFIHTMHMRQTHVQQFLSHIYFVYIRIHAAPPPPTHPGHIYVYIHVFMSPYALRIRAAAHLRERYRRQRRAAVDVVRQRFVLSILRAGGVCFVSFD
jgi:hypothetical protein